MLGFIIQRLAQAVIVMLVISALVFTGVYAVGNPIDVLISPDATQQIREQTIKAYGLDQPLWTQYGAFLGRLFSGDLGRSFVFNMPVLELVFSRSAGNTGADTCRGARRDASGRATRHVCGLQAR